MAGGVLMLLCRAAPLTAQAIATPAPSAPDPTIAGLVNTAGLVPIGGLVNIGGRRLYLACSGEGSPTVVLESGYRNSARVWSEDLSGSTAPRTMVFAGVAAFTQVCAYDRPGTISPLAGSARPSRSDPVPQPRTALEVVSDLHTLLHAAGVAGPYVFAGHSLGGLLVRLYASLYPDEVVGLILVDAYSERLEALLTPDQWQALVGLNVRLGTDAVESIPGYGDLETLGFGKDNSAMRQAVMAASLRPMPLAVLAHGIPFALPERLAAFPGETLERALRRANEDLATLVPNARLFVAAASRHDIHQDQPALVTEAIRQVVEGVRHPDTWRDLVSCCVRPP
jgi:pimeloyl-ACP methyl ester carboxylesterase